MLSPNETYMERQFRYARLCLSFLAVSSSVFLLPFFIRLFFRENFGSDSFFGYLPIFSGFYVAIVWLFTLVWPLLKLRPGSWFYKSGNAVVATVIHANLVTLPFILPNAPNDEMLSSILICNTAGAISGIVFWSLHNWNWLTRVLENSGFNRSLSFLWPIALAALYYGIFPVILPEKAYPYMMQDIRKNIFVKELAEMQAGQDLRPLFEKYPYTHLQDHALSTSGIQESWIQDEDKIYHLETKNDTILRIWVEDVKR